MDENVVVTSEWLAENAERVRIVDVRDAWEYDGIGHVPGAVNVPFDEFRSADGDQGMLPGADRWADLLGAAGITADDAIVAYDDTHGVFAARFLVTAELYGHEDLQLLDGDFSAWQRGHATTTEPPDVEPTTYRTGEPANSPLVSREAVEAAVGTEAVLVDTRSAAEFAEGHIEGAVNVDWRGLVDEETRGLKSRDELASILAKKGITPEKRVILYCNTARRISHTYVVLRSLGYEDLGFYEGSLTEWTATGGPLVGGAE